MNAAETIRLAREGVDELEQSTRFYPFTSETDPAKPDVTQVMRYMENGHRRLKLLAALLADWEDQSGQQTWPRVGERAAL
jgi:hypothetical protein